WGANAKVQALEEEYPEIFNQTSKRKNLDDPRSSINTKGEILDLQTVIKSYQALTSEIVLEKLLATLMRSLIENAGAQKSFLILKQDDRWTIEAEGKIESDEVNILRSLPINSVDSQNQTPIVPIKVINYVIRSKKNVVLDNASDDPQYNSDPYILYHRSKSVLSVPLLDRLQVTGVLYLENNLSTGVFTPDRVEFLKILAAQAAISIQNAQLYEERIKAEQALRQSEQQLTQFLEALPVGVFITTGEGKPYYLNQIAKQLIGQEVDDSLSLDRLAESYNTYLAGSDRLYPREKSPIRKALRGESSYTPDMEIRSPDRDGEIIPLDIWTSPIVNQAGKVEYTISAFQDISDRKRLEEENLLLQQVGEDLSYSYQFGGGLAANAASYVVRKADRQLYQAILQSQYCYIFNARQMGKSSLRNKIMSQLASKTYRCSAIDLTGIGSSNLNAEQWYASLVLSLSQSLGIAQFDSVKNFASWWKSFNPISPIGKFKEFICEIVLKTIDSKIVIFIDELDSIKRLSFDTNDFLALIRFLYDNRPQNPDLNRLTFVLLGAANPSTLINDLRSTPFNIGSEITLEGFKIDEIQPLARGLSDLCDDSKTVLQEILAWTGGQPFLTQKICYLIKQSRQNITAGTEALAIAKLVREEIITNWKARDNPAHLQVIEQNVLNSPNKSNLLAIYREILEKQQIYLRDRHLKTELILSGLVCCQGDLLKVFNQMYASIFNLDWLDRNQN
nr:AAA-like domain-containing protein [Prochloraceae cyanobacterium]